MAAADLVHPDRLPDVQAAVLQRATDAGVAVVRLQRSRFVRLR